MAQSMFGNVSNIRVMAEDEIQDVLAVLQPFRRRHREFIRCSRFVRSLQPGLERAWDGQRQLPRDSAD